MPLALVPTMPALVVAAALAVAPPHASPNAPRPAPPALPGMLVGGAWLAAHLDAPGLVVIHVAEQRDGYADGHVPGARRLRYDDIATEVDGIPVELPPVAALHAAFQRAGMGDDVSAVIVGTPMAAARVWATLDILGYGDRAAVLDGGLVVWTQEGRPLSRDVPPARPGRMTRAPQLDRVVDAAYVRARIGDSRTALIDARPRNEYTGADGHVPGARNLYWQELLVSPDRPLLRDTTALRERFARAGAAPGTPVVTYCYIGMRASVTYFVARLLGYDTRFYDGSWVDWTRRGMPVERGD